MGSYYEGFGETVAFDESSVGGSEMSSGERRGRWSRAPSAATGGISSESVSDLRVGSWPQTEGSDDPIDPWEKWYGYGRHGRDHRQGPRPQNTENWEWRSDAGGQDHGGWNENWSWKSGHGTGGSKPESWKGWKSWGVHFTQGSRSPSSVASLDSDRDLENGGAAKIAGSEGEAKNDKKVGKISSTYPPVFKAKPQESYLEWKRSVEFWIGGEGSQLPEELIGPRMMVQLKERAAQLVKHLGNADVNHAQGKELIFQTLERSPLIKQLDKHRIDEHRRRLMSLSRAAGESLESYVTRASLYRAHLQAMDETLTMGEAFFVGHLVDHARLTRRDKAMIKTKAGTETDEHLVTNAMIELASELEGEAGFPIGFSEPNAARNGEEWLLQRGDTRHRGAFGKGARSALLAEAADCDEDDLGEDSVDEGDLPPELQQVANEAFGMQYKARQKIAEVKKLRQYYKRPDAEEKKKFLAEKMKTNPCHSCGQYGHWSRECPLKGQAVLGAAAGSTTSPSSASSKAQSVLATRASGRAMVTVPEDDSEWRLLAEMCSSSLNPVLAANGCPASVPVTSLYKVSAVSGVKRVYAAVGVNLSEVMWSMKDLAFKVILDIGCMRSVAGTQWANLLLRRWRSEGRWCKVYPETEAFKFGDGEVLYSRYRIEFAGSFAGAAVVYGFSVVEGACPPLFSRPGCTQIGAVIDCEHHKVSVRRLGVKSYGVGQESGHYTMSIDEVDASCICLSEAFRMPEGADIVPVIASALSVSMTSETPSFEPLSPVHGHTFEPSSMPAVQQLRASDEGLPASGLGRGQLRDDVPSPHRDDRGRGPGTPPQGGTEEDDAGSGLRHPVQGGQFFGTFEPSGVGDCGRGSGFDGGGENDDQSAPGEAGQEPSKGGGPQGLDRDPGGLSLSVASLELRPGVQHSGVRQQPFSDVCLEEVCVAAEGQEGRGDGWGETVEAKPSLDLLCGGTRGGDSLGPFRGNEAEDLRAGDLAVDVRRTRPRRGLTQKMKGAVQEALGALALVEKAAKDVGSWKLLEIFAGHGGLSALARRRTNWVVLEPVDIITGWDLHCPERRKALSLDRGGGA